MSTRTFWDTMTPEERKKWFKKVYPELSPTEEYFNKKFDELSAGEQLLIILVKKRG